MSRGRTVAAALTVTATALVGIAQWEGFREKAYDDGTGVQTVGFGTTRNVTPSTRVTPERGLVLLLEDAQSHAAEIQKCIGDVPLYQYEWDAYVSLSYNIGSSAFCKSTLAKKLQARDYEGACRQILRWVYAGGRKMQGLVNRRADEYETCIGAKNVVVATR